MNDRDILREWLRSDRPTMDIDEIEALHTLVDEPEPKPGWIQRLEGWCLDAALRIAFGGQR